METFKSRGKVVDSISLALMAAALVLKAAELFVALATFDRISKLEIAARPQGTEQAVRMDPEALGQLKEMVAQRNRQDQRGMEVLRKLEEMKNAHAQKEERAEGRA